MHIFECKAKLGVRLAAVGDVQVVRLVVGVATGILNRVWVQLLFRCHVVTGRLDEHGQGTLLIVNNGEGEGRVGQSAKGPLGVAPRLASVEGVVEGSAGARAVFAHVRSDALIPACVRIVHGAGPREPLKHLNVGGDGGSLGHLGDVAITRVHRHRLANKVALDTRVEAVAEGFEISARVLRDEHDVNLKLGVLLVDKTAVAQHRVHGKGVQLGPFKATVGSDG
mmetsp:Transcript_9945/g.31541  ORF Transcript_9945/g.31541 Transcript_9945/m.31541 type:complete len:224 (+) Transcript_9945:3086-3757(+)